MSLFSSKTFNEELSELRTNFFVTLEKYKGCNDKERCQQYEDMISDMINMKTLELNNKIKTSLGKMDTLVSDLNFNMSNQKDLKNVFAGTLMRLDRGDLAAEPRRHDAWELKIYHFVHMVYYILGSIALIYFIKTQLKIKESKISKYNAPIKNLPKNTDAKKGGWRRK
jgi:hypothetical protein